MESAVSKGDFAKLIGVTAGRVSQYISAGKISQSALIGSGRNAKVNVERARADLRSALDISQRLGNGIDTRLDDDAPVVPPNNGFSFQQPVIPQPSGVEHDIKQAKLEQLRRANRNGAIAEAKDRGQLIELEAAKAEMSKVAGAMLQVFEGALSDFSAAVSAEFKLPQRDVLHLLRKQLRKVRERAALQAQAKAVTLPETVETELAAEDIESLN